MENNKELTPMQELIHIIKSKRKESDISNTLLRFCQVEAEKLLPKEKQVIEDAVKHGFNDATKTTINRDVSFNDYYNTKYNNQIK